MRFELYFDMDNAAFEDAGNNGTEAARILREIATRVEFTNLAPLERGQAKDANGNKVGIWHIGTDEHSLIAKF